MIKSWRQPVLLLLVAGAVAACAPAANPLRGGAGFDGLPAGFLLGIWHGFTIVFAFVASLFVDTVGVYEVHNTGWPYNLGYLFGVMMFFGGGGASAREARRRKHGG
jgi:hypothetical protein